MSGTVQPQQLQLHHTSPSIPVVPPPPPQPQSAHQTPTQTHVPAPQDDKQNKKTYEDYMARAQPGFAYCSNHRAYHPIDSFGSTPNGLNRTCEQSRAAKKQQRALKKGVTGGVGGVGVGVDELDEIDSTLETVNANGQPVGQRGKKRRRIEDEVLVAAGTPSHISNSPLALAQMGYGTNGISSNPLALSIALDKHLIEALKISKTCSTQLLKTQSESTTLKEMNKLLKEENDRLSKGTGTGTSSSEFIQLITDLQSKIRDLERENSEQKALIARFMNVAKKAEAPLETYLDLANSPVDEEDMYVGAPVSGPSASTGRVGSLGVKGLGGHGHGQGVGFVTPSQHGGYGMSWGS